MFFLMLRLPPISTLFPYTTLFRSNNNDNLWSRLNAVVKQYLQGIWQQGVLQGDTADQAFFVQCDNQNNTPTTVAAGEVQDRKSTRLNSSHVEISYAVFCLKKKIKN